MKKVFVIFMSCVLLFSLALPFGVHAAEVHSDEFPLGEWVLNDNLDIQTLIDISDDVDGKKVSYFDFTFYSGFHERTVECNGVSPIIASNGTFKMRYLFSDGQYYQVYAGATFTRDTDRVINITSVPSDSAVIEWLYANATPPQGEPEPEPEPMCDGTACSWADDDYNGICDTCGLSLMSFRYNLLDYAHEHLTEGMNYFNGFSYWVIYSSAGTTESYDILLSSEPFVYRDGGLTSGTPYYFTTVMFNSDGVPADIGWRSVANSTITIVDPKQAVEVSHNIDGFFPLPLRQMVEVEVNKSLLQMVEKMGGILIILMACGVGLMACLVVLNLFGKRSLIYHKQ